MTKSNFYKYAALGLLLLNLLVIGFFISKKMRQPSLKDRGPKNIIIKKLSFDKEQQVEYQKLIDVHFSNIKAASDQIGLLKQALYSTLNAATPNPTQSDSLLNEITLLAQTIEQTHYAHFWDIKKICRPDQQQKFEALSEELAMLFSRRPNPKKGE